MPLENLFFLHFSCNQDSLTHTGEKHILLVQTRTWIVEAIDY